MTETPDSSIDGAGAATPPQPSAQPSGSPGRAWPLSLGLAAGTLVLYLFVVRGLEVPHGSFILPWWALAGLFLVVESCMVHLHFRREAHSFTVSELPLAVALFFAAPAVVLPARLLGAGIALVFVQRQRPVKIAFNLSLFALETCIALIVFQALAGGIGLQWSSFLAALMALVTVSTFSVFAVFVVIALVGGGVQIRQQLTTLPAGLAVTVANGSIALVGVAIAWTNPSLGLLVLVPAAVLLVAYRAQLAEQRRRASVEFLYQTARSLQDAPDTRTATVTLLAQASETFRAARAEAVLFPSASEAGVRIVSGPEGVQIEEYAEGTPGAAELLPGLPGGEATLLSRPPGGIVLPWRRSERPDAMIAPLRGDRRVIGTLLLSDRLGDASSFDGQDFRLFETLAHQAAVSLEAIELGQQLQHRAFHDALTDLPNRAFLRRYLDDLLAQQDRLPGPAVFLLDLDDFKSVNDSLGHAAGDKLLITVAERLAPLAASAGKVARFGGDEFALVLEDVTGEDAISRFAEQVLGALARPFVLEAREVSILGSLGIALPDDTRPDAEDLLRNADLAMYEAKSGGKGKYAIFEAPMHDRALQRVEIKNDLHRALQRDEFSLHYQPLVDLGNGEIVGVEALARWRHPRRGFVSPVDFIPLLEETGLIVELGKWALREAMRQTREWQDRDEAHSGLKIAINLSPVHVRRPDVVGDVAAAIDATGIDPATVTLEITEGIFLGDADQAIQTLDALARLGLRLAIDDFGTGYSSLNYLARFPIDVLKIDKAFVDGITHGTTDSVVAGAIVGLSASLGLTTLAEGIEHPEQRDALRRLGCDLGQGYLFARPLPPDETERLLFSPRNVVSLAAVRAAGARAAVGA